MFGSASIPIAAKLDTIMTSLLKSIPVTTLFKSLLSLYMKENELISRPQLSRLLLLFASRHSSSLRSLTSHISSLSSASSPVLVSYLSWLCVSSGGSALLSSGLEASYTEISGMNATTLLSSAFCEKPAALPSIFEKMSDLKSTVPLFDEISTENELAIVAIPRAKITHNSPPKSQLKNREPTLQRHLDRYWGRGV